MEQEREFDVVIIGAGVAGGCLARQIKLELPHLRVLQLDRETVFRYKVGESTVEPAGFYLHHILKLSTYLNNQHLGKNGLRYFFDSPEKDLPLSEMAEIGTTQWPDNPAYQLNRSTLDRDLADMNREAGVEVLLGAVVTAIELSEAGQQHTVRYKRKAEPDVSHVARARWVVDASGRNAMLAKQLGIREKVEALPTCASWGRFKNIQDIDAHPDEAWRRRVRYTPRFLSTNHFMYEGYWYWVIPLSGGYTSIGVVIDTTEFDGPLPRRQEEFLEFSRSHRAIKDLLDGSEMIDFLHFPHLAYTTKRFYSPQRWALIGDAASFHDPLVSLGTTLISYQNMGLLALLRADFVGDPRFEEHVEFYEGFIQRTFASFVSTFANQYVTWGSSEVWRYKHLFGHHMAMNVFTWPLMWGYYKSADELKRALSSMPPESFGVAGYFQSTLFRRVYDALAARGAQLEGNDGRFADYYRLGFERLLAERDPLEAAELRVQLHRDLCRGIFSWAVERINDVTGFARRRLIQEALDFGVILAHKEATPEALEPLLARVGARLAELLEERFPGAKVEPFALTLDGLAGELTSVAGDLGSASEAEVLAAANELWAEEYDNYCFRKPWDVDRAGPRDSVAEPVAGAAE